MTKIVYEGRNDKEKVVNGIKKAVNIITSTYGGQGGVVMYQPLHGPANFTKDGYEVSKNINFNNSLENVGAKLVQEACDKMAFRVGDGTTTMAAIIGEIIDEAFKYEISGIFPREIANGIIYGIDEALKNLKEVAIQIKKDDYKSIHSVALVSSNYDTKVASFIEEAYKQINEKANNQNPVILIEEAKTEHSSINIVKGMQLQRGIFSPQFFKKEEKNKMKIEFNNPYIMVFGKSITRNDIQQMLHIFDEIIKKGKSCLIVASDFSEEVVNFFLINRHNGISDWVCVKTPGFGDGQIAIAQDIAIRTGGKVLCENGFLPENISLNDFIGQADKVCIERNETVIIGGKGSEIEINERQKFLQEELNNTVSQYNKDQIQNRMSSLNGVICVIKVGGVSEMVVKETKDRVEDANHATKNALISGIVPGGGIDTLYVSNILKEKLKKENNLQRYERLGLEILIKVLQKPFNMLVQSCGLSGDLCGNMVLEKYKENNRLEYGIDVRTGELINFLQKGILNPAAVSVGILNMLREIVPLFILCKVFIVDVPEEEKGFKEGFNRLS